MPGGSPTGVVSWVGLKDVRPTGDCDWGAGSFAEDGPVPFGWLALFGVGDFTSATNHELEKQSSDPWKRNVTLPPETRLPYTRYAIGHLVQMSACGATGLFD
uniref:Uncharacterized protein n=1 Tax=Anopheles merus TaxID=30066 RepID=A0A182UMV7_ANOME